MDYGLIGEKLGHSYSKLIHEKFGFYTYELKEIPRDELDAFMRAKDFKGINVTIPYKQDVIKYLDYIDDKARAIGAVNTVVNKDGKLYGYNTDYFGLKTLLDSNEFDLKNKKVLILGTGGTSKTAYAVCEDSGASFLCKVSRSAKDGALSYEDVYEKHSDASYIVNTTPAGMYPNLDGMPIDLKRFTNLEGVADVIYNPLRTRLIEEAEELEIKNCSGLRMLVYQAVAACEFFIGKKPNDNVSESIISQLVKENENIVLTGMPGSGKSTIGQLISKELNKEFIDTDALIVKREKREISDIFAKDGEAYFRDVEAEVIKEVSLKKNCIISTGGGAILRDENVRNLAANGKIYFLDRKPEDLIPTDDRPLANEKSKIMKLYEDRLPIYQSTCDVIINVEVGIEDTLNEMLKKINR